MSLSLVSLNIERAKHYDRIFPFLETHRPDVFCVQELFARDVPRFEAALGGTAHFAPLSFHPVDPPETGAALEGVAIITALPVLRAEVYYYAGSAEAIERDGVASKSGNRPVIVAEIQKGDEVFRVATTHFTWTPDGTASVEQREDSARLISFMQQWDDFALCGDFNAPRGGEIFSKFAREYSDNIPHEYVWSLDLSLHRAGGGKIQTDAKAMGMDGFMIDVLFSKGRIRAEHTRLLDGLSDHMAVVSDLSLA